MTRVLLIPALILPACATPPYSRASLTAPATRSIPHEPAPPPLPNHTPNLPVCAFPVPSAVHQ